MVQRGRTARGWVAVVFVAGLAAACVPPLPEPVVVETLPAGAAEVLAARETVEGHLVDVAGAIVAMPDRLDELRHAVDRGSAQAALHEAVARQAATLDDDAEALLADAATLTGDRVAEAGRLAGELAELGHEAAAAAQQDLAELAPLIAFDAVLEQRVQEWDIRGSRSQQVERFQQLVVDTESLVGEARRLEVGRCPGLRTNRIRWAELIAFRTAELRDAALDRAGNRFDQLRDTYARGPYGEDRAVADAESTVCWERGEPASTLVDLAERAETLVTGIQEALG